MLFTTPVHSPRPWPGAEDLCEQRPGTATPAAGARTAVAWPRPRAPPRRDRPAPRRRRRAGRAPAAASSSRRPAPARRSWRRGAPPDRRAPRAGSARAAPPAALRAPQMQPPAARCPRLLSVNQTHPCRPDTALYRPEPTRSSCSCSRGPARRAGAPPSGGCWCGPASGPAAARGPAPPGARRAPRWARRRRPCPRRPRARAGSAPPAPPCALRAPASGAKPYQALPNPATAARRQDGPAAAPACSMMPTTACSPLAPAGASRKHMQGVQHRSLPANARRRLSGARPAEAWWV